MKNWNLTNGMEERESNRRENDQKGGDFWRKERDRTRQSIEDGARRENGLLIWNSNDRLVPSSILDEAGLVASDAQRKAEEKQNEKSLAEYREARKNHTPSEEELFEMRAAFGEGTTVVDVFTGKKIQL